MPILRALAFLILALVVTTPAVADEALWQAMKQGGHVIIFRHALAPGTGDPPGFKLDDCSTQRNLSEAGREQAKAIGEAFRAQGVKVDRVMTSRWCRARDTATLMALGTVEEAPMLDSFFGNREREPAQTEALKQFLATVPAGETIVMVSHQVNISALAGDAPSSGEAVVIKPEPGKPGAFTVKGWMPFPVRR